MADITSLAVVTGPLFHTLRQMVEAAKHCCYLGTLRYFMLVLLLYFTHAALLGSLPVSRTLSVGYVVLPDSIRDSYLGSAPPWL